jgi:hypothetical protein
VARAGVAGVTRPLAGFVLIRHVDVVRRDEYHPHLGNLITQCCSQRLVASNGRANVAHDDTCNCGSKGILERAPAVGDIDRRGQRVQGRS